MSLPSRLSFLALASMLAACTTTATPPMSDPTPSAGVTCDPAPAQSLVGQPATAANVERARQLAGARTARVLKPGQMVTMEYMDGRLNVYVDAKNVIERIHCG
jgi:hypothetical protein